MSEEQQQPTPQSEGAQTGDEKTGNKRRNRRRGKKRPADPAAAAPQPNATATVRPEVKPAPKARPEAPQQPQRKQGPAQGPAQGPTQGPKPKQERPPRGSVLQRRSSRPEPAFMKEPDAAPAPAPAPISANSVDEYVKQLHGWQREVVMTLRSLIKSTTPDAKESILWSQPVYSIKGPVVYIKAFTDHVNLGFWRGNDLEDPENLLTGELPTMRHVTIRHINDLKKEAYERMIRQAFKMDKEKGDATA